MKKRLPLSVKHKLQKLGEDLKKARLRRRIKMSVIADRAGISKETLSKIQKGDPGVGMGTYATVIFAIGLGSDWLDLADIKNDKVGQIFDEERIPMRARD
ncbi:MAG: helix-turn-helix transcriptional regulator [Desulfobacterales bacterium]|nr:helix-turn-helix transcriptional regulator [Desulfobacterales bacterium]